MSAANIIVTEKIYINYSIRKESEYNPITKQHENCNVRLGYATYDDESVAFQKRKQSIDKWADNSESGDFVDNVPRSGYTFGKAKQHGGGRWSAVSTNWRIVDPMGFELEINSGNMEELIRYCTIDKGTILDECVWGWNKDTNKVILVPIESDVYKDAKKGTITHFSEAIDPSEVQLGDMVEYKNGQLGIYFGKAYMVSIDKSNYFTQGTYLGRIETEAIHILMMDNNIMHFMKSPKIVKASKSDSRYTQEEAEVYLNKVFEDPKTRKDGSYSHSCIFLTYKKKLDASLQFTEVTLDSFRSDVRARWATMHQLYAGSFVTKSGPYIMDLEDGSQVLFTGFANGVSLYHTSHAPTKDFLDGAIDDVEIQVAEIKNTDYIGTNVGIIPKTKKIAAGRYNYDGYEAITRNVILSTISKVYTMASHVEGRVIAPR